VLVPEDGRDRKMFQANTPFLRRAISTVIVFSLVAVSSAAVCDAKSARLVLTPKFSAGETLVYQIEMQTTTAGKTVTPIMNNEGATEASLRIGMRERLEVLSIATQDHSVRFRLTWDDSHADAISDALDPATGDPAASFKALQGQSVEFTLSPNGALSDFKGLENVLPGGMPPPESVAWIASLASARVFPHGGIEVGQHWRSERPISGAPLADLFWSTASTYDRNEACAPFGNAGATTPHPGQQCAVIVTQMSIARHGGTRSDQTPLDYLHNGLRTAGTWTGSGQQLASISVQTGLLVSATETSSQNMDYTITSASSGSSIHYTAKVQSQTGITLVSQ
jgi:hypothetical protein